MVRNFFWKLQVQIGGRRSDVKRQVPVLANLAARRQHSSDIRPHSLPTADDDPIAHLTARIETTTHDGVESSLPLPQAGMVEQRQHEDVRRLHGGSSGRLPIFRTTLSRARITMNSSRSASTPS
jgi:hypothetical protein